MQRNLPTIYALALEFEGKALREARHGVAIVQGYLHEEFLGKESFGLARFAKAYPSKEPGAMTAGNMVNLFFLVETFLNELEI